MTEDPFETAAIQSGRRTVELSKGQLVVYRVLIFALLAIVVLGGAVAVVHFFTGDNDGTVRFAYLALAGVLIGGLGTVIQLAAAITDKSSPARTITSLSLIVFGTVLAVVCAFLALNSIPECLGGSCPR